jgi:predicted sulfurtransferase
MPLRASLLSVLHDPAVVTVAAEPELPPASDVPLALRPQCTECSARSGYSAYLLRDSVFDDLRVKLRHRVVADGLPAAAAEDAEADGAALSTSGARPVVLSPAQWHALLERRTAASEEAAPDFLLVDTRNIWESKVGHFEGAHKLDVRPERACFFCVKPPRGGPLIQVDAFRDVAPAMEALLEGRPKDVEVAMYCTGGVRCVKLATHLSARGFSKIYRCSASALPLAWARPRASRQRRAVPRLDGGINAYHAWLATAPGAVESRYRGRNFSFDKRALAHARDTVTDDVLVSVRRRRLRALCLQHASHHVHTGELRAVRRAGRHLYQLRAPHV